MFNGQTFYHGAIRKTIIAFGRLFSDIKIEREGNDGNVAQTISVPLAYAPKEKWLVRIDSDPGLNNHTYISLPRLSFEITGYSYDASRKTNKMQKIVCTDGVSSGNPNRKSVFAPVPYNVDISLYVLTKTHEDAMQIIEQILPSFNPEYTLTVNSLPDVELTNKVPVILNGISVEDSYDGDFQTRRFVTHTLTFTLKINLYGPVSQQGIINDVKVNLSQPGRKYEASSPAPTDPITENWESSF